MIKFACLFTLLFHSFSAYCTDRDAFAYDPNALVDNHFSVATGQFIDQRKDLLQHSHAPIHLYSAFSTYVEGSKMVYKLMPHLYLDHVKVGEQFFIHIRNEKGHHYRGWAPKVSKSKKETSIYHIGLSGAFNTANGLPSGQTSPRNIKITHRHSSDTFEVVAGDGTVRIYIHDQPRLLPGTTRFDGVNIQATRYVLDREVMRDGKVFTYHYHGKGDGKRVHQIKSFSSDKKRKYGEVTLEDIEGKKYEIHAHNLSKRHEYLFFHYNRNRYPLNLEQLNKNTCLL